jgi:hypothetical protein
VQRQDEERLCHWESRTCTWTWGRGRWPWLAAVSPGLRFGGEGGWDSEVGGREVGIPSSNFQLSFKKGIWISREERKRLSGSEVVVSANEQIGSLAFISDHYLNTRKRKGLQADSGNSTQSNNSTQISQQARVIRGAGRGVASMDGKWNLQEAKGGILYVSYEPPEEKNLWKPPQEIWTHPACASVAGK